MRTLDSYKEHTVLEHYRTNEEYLRTYIASYSGPRLLSYRKWLPVIEKFRQTGRLLDVGCGPGHFVREAKLTGWDATGLEVSPLEVQYGRSELGVNIIQGTVEENVPEGDFDIVTFWDVLEHLSDPISALKTTARILLSPLP
jgi:2-polyprenyl-3-methyl-5-hydroxy-6-metoxy-1,4-benzoquinol methylase